MLESRDSWVPTAVPSHIRLTTATIAMMRVSWTLNSLTSLCSRRRRLRNINIKNTSVDPKQFTVSKFRLKPVTLISECFCSRCGHANHPPTPHLKGDNRRQRETRPLQSPRSRPHQPTRTSKKPSKFPCSEDGFSHLHLLMKKRTNKTASRMTRNRNACAAATTTSEHLRLPGKFETG